MHEFPIELRGAKSETFIHDVVAAQSELVDVVQHLRTILCVKG